MEGMSLFQGAASIHINNSAQDRLEEQEEIEDQKRRNEELQHKLANAFDDLLDDDEVSSANSSGNFTLEPRQSNANGIPQQCPVVLPTYVESLNHVKDVHHMSESPKQYCESPHLQQQEEAMKMPFNAYGAGDGQNNYFQQDFRGHLNGINNYEARQEYMNNEQLKVIYEMRVKECQQLAGQMQKLDTEIDSLRARLTAAINDRDKAELSLQEAHHLLASSKHKLIELEQQVSNLKDKLVESDQDKEELKLELRSANMSLQDVQQRLHTLQIAHTHDTDALFREQQDRHREEMDRLQNDLTKAKRRIDEKDNEIKILERRCKEKDREKEEILIDKGATINRLANELESAQNRLISGETPRLKEKVSQLTSERNAAKEQVKELGSKLEVTAHELVLCRNKLAANQKEFENWQTTLYQILIESLPDNTYLGESPSPGKLATIKEVLNRYKSQLQKLPILQEEIAKRDKKMEQYRKQESELKTKLEEHKAIETQMNSRIIVLQNKVDLLSSNVDSELVESYRQQLEQQKEELERVRDELKRLELKHVELEMEYEKLKAEKGSRASIVQEANADLLRELERYSAQLKDTLKENGELKNLYLQACSSRDTASRELKDLVTKSQKEKELFKTQETDLVERIEKQKQQIEKLNSDLASSKGELESANKRISELQREFTDKQREFTNKLNKYLEDEKTAMRNERIEPCSQCEKHTKHIRFLDDQLNKCNLKLESQANNEALMQELKGKAEFFQQYIVDRFKKLRDQRDASTHTDEAMTGTPQETVSTQQLLDNCDDGLAAKTDMMMKEKAIRDQIAEKFTLEMKTMEMNCAIRVKAIEDEQLQVVTKLKGLLERKAQEVETLKEFIISEREKIAQIMESKENEISELIKEHNELRTESQKVKDQIPIWMAKAEKYKDMVIEMKKTEKMFKTNHEDLRNKLSWYNNESQAMKAKVQELQKKMSELQQKYDALQKEHQVIQNKYKSVKSTTLIYKDYVEKKDAHISNEMNRIQDEYKKIFVKLQNQINYHVNCRIAEEKSRGNNAQTQQYQQPDFAETINRLGQEFARLAQSRFNGKLPSENPK